MSRWRHLYWKGFYVIYSPTVLLSTILCAHVPPRKNISFGEHMMSSFIAANGMALTYPVSFPYMVYRVYKISTQ